MNSNAFDRRSDLYFAWMLNTSHDERALRKRILSKLPYEIADMHTHANGREAVGQISDYARRQVRASFPEWSLRDSFSLRNHLWGDSRIRRLTFAQPYRGIDHVAANAYLLSNAPDSDLVALCGLPDDEEYTLDQMQSKRYAALKMYPHYFEPAATTLARVFPPRVVRAAANFRLPLIVHLPRPLAQSLDELIDLARSADPAIVVLAHVGREFDATAAAQQALAAVSRQRNVVVDSAMVTDVQVLGAALEAFGPQRVMYGSDEPMNLLRYVAFDHPVLGRRLVSEYPYEWLDDGLFRDYRHLAAGATLLHWQCLDALQRAIDGQFAEDRRSAVYARVFFQNAVDCFWMQSGP